MCLCVRGKLRGIGLETETERELCEAESVYVLHCQCVCVVCQCLLFLVLSVCRFMCVVPSACQSGCPSVSIDNYSHSDSLMLLCESVKTTEGKCPDVVKTHVTNKGLKDF